MVSDDLDSTVDPNFVSSRSGVETDELPLASGGASISQGSIMRSPSVSSVKSSKFRTTVGSKAMADACKKRRKSKDACLFASTQTGHNFTALHNSKSMFLH